MHVHAWVAQCVIFNGLGLLFAVQLEWNMKLWWPHCEAMVAFAYAYKVTKDERYKALFDKVAKYTFDHFPDAVHGEWFGYLVRDTNASSLSVLLEPLFKSAPGSTSCNRHGCAHCCAGP